MGQVQGQSYHHASHDEDEEEKSRTFHAKKRTHQSRSYAQQKQVRNDEEESSGAVKTSCDRTLDLKHYQTIVLKKSNQCSPEAVGEWGASIKNDRLKLWLAEHSRCQQSVPSERLKPCVDCFVKSFDCNFLISFLRKK
jgi:hypothetical protein